MFEPSTTPRLFATPVGVDFGAALLEGLEARLADAPPVAWGEITIYVNSTRMLRHLRSCFAAGPARLMPDMRLITSLAEDPRLGPIAPAKSSLRLRLELRQAVARLIEVQPDLARPSAAFDLATSLAGLLEELHGEGISREALEAIDVAEFSAHWARNLDLISILFGDNSDIFRGSEAVNREAALKLVELWESAPPSTPVLIAGSTGSRGTTRLLMEAVAHLPQGGVVLPGFDFEQPSDVWQSLVASARDPDGVPEEDHPQFRFADLMSRLDVAPSNIAPWSKLAAPAPARNALVSLALRPAPVTDQWRRDGPKIVGNLAEISSALTLIEAPTPRHEAETIALALRQAVEEGKAAALVTPDRNLARQVSAALRQWQITADDSAGTPLHQSPPGRLLMEIAQLFGQPVTLGAALSLLKHPLTASTAGLRGPHLLALRKFERWARGNGVPLVDHATIERWLDDEAAGEDLRAWGGWIEQLLGQLCTPTTATLVERLNAHVSLANSLAAGAGTAGSGALWEAAAGEAARSAVAELEIASDAGGLVSNRDYSAIFRQFFAGKEVRHSVLPHPGVAIWGTIEARTEVVDLCVLAGLNEGTWPASPAQDPWMNRAMRRAAGMLSPERRIGLSAHDFQQALGAAEVILSRSARDAEAETVPARWLNRLTNLLGGLHPQGASALETMRRRGNRLLAASAALSREGSGAPISPGPAPRPSPSPPIEKRPRGLFVTSVATLIRDPYAIYARHVLRLRPLGPLSRQADAAMRGTVLHAVMERALTTGFDFRAAPETAIPEFLELARSVISQQVPWPATARLWHARFAAAAPALIRIEAELQAAGEPIVIEKTGSVSLENVDFVVSAKPDRIDRLRGGGCAVLDYKTSSAPPSQRQVEQFDKQLLIEAAMAEAGGFGKLGRERAKRVGYISIGRPEKSRDEELEADGVWRPAQVMHDLAVLIEGYRQRSRGYTARRAPQLILYQSDYDHLSRFGEWDDTTAAELVRVGE